MNKENNHCTELEDNIKDLLQKNTSLQRQLNSCTQQGSKTDELLLLNMELQLLHQCTRAIVQAQEIPELLRDVCQIMVETGQYRLAWFGKAEEDTVNTVRPVAQYGYENGYPADLQLTWDDARSGHGQTVEALRTGRPSVARHIMTDPAFEPWRARASERGYASSIALPVSIEGKMYGALCVYAAEANAFDNDEVMLLHDLAVNLSYAINILLRFADYRQVQKDLLESEQRYKAVVDNLGIGITLLTPNMEIVALNRNMRQWFPNVAIEKTPLCYETFNSPPRKTICSYCPVCKTLEDGELHESFTETPAGDEIRNYRIVATPIKDQHGKVTAAIEMVEDVTEQMRNEELREALMAQLETKNHELEAAYKELQESQSQMLQQEKMASIGQLAAGVAHEINNPIAFVASNLRTMDKYVARLLAVIADQSDLLASLLPAEQQEKLMQKHKNLKLDSIIVDSTHLINESLEGTERVTKIVQGLKTFARVDEADFVAADINECLESTINMVWNELKYKATVKKEYAMLPMTKCFPNQLNQVFMNLLINASQAIPNFGEIIVKTWLDDIAIFTSISDTGIGIEEKSLHRIFDPFYTTKDVGKGTGLGLSITYDIVTKNHHGEIAVKSEVGKGTTFTVKIPVVPVAE